MGSGPGSRPANSGIDSGALVFQPAASPGTRATASRPSQPAPAATLDSFPALGVEVAPQVAASAKDKQPAKKPVTKPLQFAGLPIAFWIIALGGVALAIGLAIAVLIKK